MKVLYPFKEIILCKCHHKIEFNQIKSFNEWTCLLYDSICVVFRRHHYQCSVRFRSSSTFAKVNNLKLYNSDVPLSPPPIPFHQNYRSTYTTVLSFIICVFSLSLLFLNCFKNFFSIFFNRPVFPSISKIVFFLTLSMLLMHKCVIDILTLTKHSTESVKHTIF